MAVQWLRLCTSNAGAVGSIPGWGTKIPHATWPKKNLKVSVSHDMGELSFYNGVINFSMNEQFLLMSLLSIVMQFGEL